ncbi:MAG TPA: co-chaperone GroES [Dehalococcoidia bacterium]|nr:co-chaperone GroES [Dehalococcoidia bacterium]
METKLKPLGDNVLVRVAKAEEKIGSIVVPDAAQKKPRKGEVLAVGEGRWANDHNLVRIESAVKPGNVVLFGSYAGVEVGEGLLMLKEADLLAVEERPALGDCVTQPEPTL